MIVPYNETTDVFVEKGNSVYTTATEQPLVYLMLTGFPASQVVGYVELSTVLEFVPTPETRSLFGADVVARECPRTREFLEGLFIKFK